MKEDSAKWIHFSILRILVVERRQVVSSLEASIEALNDFYLFLICLLKHASPVKISLSRSKAVSLSHWNRLIATFSLKLAVIYLNLAYSVGKIELETCKLANHFLNCLVAGIYT